MVPKTETKQGITKECYNLFVAQVDSYRLKISILGAAALLLAIVFGYTFSVFTTGASYFYLLTASVAALLFLVVFLLQTILVSDHKTVALLIFLETLGMSLPLLRRPSIWLLPVSLTVFLLLYWSYLGGRYGLTNMLKISFIKLRYYVLTIAAAAIVLFMVSNYLILFGQQPSVSEKAVNFIARPLLPLIGRFLPDFSFDKSVAAVFELVTYRVYEKEINQLPLPEQSQFIKSTVLELKKSVDKATDIRLGLDENIIAASHRVINALLARSLERLRGTALFVFGLLLFLVVSSGTYFINLLVSFLAWLIFKLLLAKGLVYTTFKNIKQEIINI